MQKNVPIPTRGSNTDLWPTDTSVEMDCATGVHVTRSGAYINGSDEIRDVCKVDVKCNI